MKIAGILICLLVLVSSILGTERVITLEEEYRLPVLMCMSQGRAYVREGKRVVVDVYCLDKGVKLYSIGHRGEGPGEFLWINRLTVHGDRVMVSGNQKLIYYDRNGKFLKEIKVPYGFGNTSPLDEKFACKVFDNFPGKTVISIQVLDSDFHSLQKLEEFGIQRPYRGKNGKVNGYIFQDRFGYRATNKIIVVGNPQKGFHFGIFDKNGKKIRAIDLEHQKIPVTEEQKKSFLTRLRDSLGSTRYKRLLAKNNIIFPDDYPAYETFDVSDQKIYVRLHPVINNTHQLLVLDLKGNKLNQHTIPVHGSETTFQIYNSHYCYLKENEDLEQWQLYLHPLE